jgi:ParB family chromosome partitioning protein
MADVAPVETPPAEADAERSGVRSVPIERIKPNADQPRRDFDDDQLSDLANSIREKGVIQPLILREHPDDKGEFQIVAGERRWRAAQLAKLHDLPAIVRDYTEAEVLEIAIIENIQRAELNALEEAAGYRQLMDRFGHTQEKISEALSKSRSHIANLLRLLTLPDAVQMMVRDGVLSAGHARALVTAKNPEALAKQIVAKGLSVRETEKLVKAPVTTKPKSPSAPKTKDADTVALERDLSAATGMKVRIDHTPGQQAGRISVDYSSLDDLDRLCNLLNSLN